MLGHQNLRDGSDQPMMKLVALSGSRQVGVGLLLLSGYLCLYQIV